MKHGKAFRQALNEIVHALESRALLRPQLTLETRTNRRHEPDDSQHEDTLTFCYAAHSFR